MSLKKLTVFRFTGILHIMPQIEVNKQWHYIGVQMYVGVPDSLFKIQNTQFLCGNETNFSGNKRQISSIVNTNTLHLSLSKTISIHFILQLISLSTLILFFCLFLQLLNDYFQEVYLPTFYMLLCMGVKLGVCYNKRGT
jgi:hypothetical protein